MLLFLGKHKRNKDWAFNSVLASDPCKAVFDQCPQDNLKLLSYVNPTQYLLIF